MPDYPLFWINESHSLIVRLFQKVSTATLRVRGPIDVPSVYVL